ncbi:MAG: prepilin-type N-terminal cleavage/methylation domain-containing protein [candidate division Zixibacteria bacterium]|nr:prepilin-type N-terminal cleavage/methylation domain-containing protein [candidate division Zixibacteria bacterium]
MRKNIIKAGFKSLINCRGLSLLELLIAALITGIMATAAFSFYSKMHIQSETQYEISECQLMCRTSLSDIRKTLRMAGYKIATPPFYEINGDSLSIYFSDTQPVDTIIYFLREFSVSDYQKYPGLPPGTKMHRLMKQINSAPPSIFTDFIEEISFTAVDAANVDISITAHASRSDDSYKINGGYHIYTLSERVNIRNAG